MRVPWWTLLIALLVGSLATYAWATRQRDGTIEEIRAQMDSVSAVGEAERVIARARVAALKDSLARVEVKRDTIEIERREASGAVEVSGSNLQHHLDLREDTAGLRLWTEHEAADAHLADLWSEERSIWQAQIRMRVELEAGLRNIIASQDTELVALRGSFLAMQAEAERWRLKAEPPWVLRFLKDGAECGVGGVAAWGLSSEPVVGIGAAGACLLVKQILP